MVSPVPSKRFVQVCSVLVKILTKLTQFLRRDTVVVILALLYGYDNAHLLRIQAIRTRSEKCRTDALESVTGGAVFSCRPQTFQTRPIDKLKML
jgi:hypothetical protein